MGFISSRTRPFYWETRRALPLINMMEVVTYYRASPWEELTVSLLSLKFASAASQGSPHRTRQILLHWIDVTLSYTLISCRICTGLKFWWLISSFIIICYKEGAIYIALKLKYFSFELLKVGNYNIDNFYTEAEYWMILMRCLLELPHSDQSTYIPFLRFHKWRKNPHTISIAHLSRLLVYCCFVPRLLLQFAVSHSPIEALLEIWVALQSAFFASSTIHGAVLFDFLLLL